MKFYLSCRKPIPESEILDAEVAVAMEDWAEIPADRIAGICAEARRTTGDFLPSNGVVIEIWRESNNRNRPPIVRDLIDYTPEREAAIKAAKR